MLLETFDSLFKYKISCELQEILSFIHVPINSLI